MSAVQPLVREAWKGTIWDACTIRQQHIADERRDRDLAQAAYDDERADLRRELAQDRYGR